MQNKQLEDILDKVKYNLICRPDNVFLSTIIFSSIISWDESIKTANVSIRNKNIHMKLNPNFFMSLDTKTQEAVLGHEAWHVALDHVSRLKNRNPEKFNIAGDYVINLLLHNSGYTIPDNWLFNYAYTNMSTEQIYALLTDDEVKNFNDTGIGSDIEFINENLSAQEKQLQNKIIDNVLTRAKLNAEVHNENLGYLPGELKRKLLQLSNPTLPWEVLLANFMEGLANNDYSWVKPNKRFDTVILPSMYSESIANLTIAIDTSGSIDDDILRNLLSEVKYIHEHYKPTKLTIIDCDYKINNIHEVTQDTDIQSLTFTGNGGTQFKPVFDYCNERNTKALLYFTDLYGDDDLENPDYPVLWLCYSNREPSKIGQTVYFNI